MVGYFDLFGVCVGPMLGHFGRENKPKRTLFVWGSFGGLFWANVEPMMGHVGFKLGPYWIILQGKNNPNRKRFGWGSFWGCVGPMFGNLGSTLGPCLGIWWAMQVPPWFLEVKKWTPTKTSLLRFILEALEGLRRTNAGPTLGHNIIIIWGLCWARVRSFGGQWRASWCRKKLCKRNRFHTCFFNSPISVATLKGFLGSQ